MSAAQPSWVALFRGINVGGKHLLPMAELRELLSELGLREVKSYIQSGNVVFRAAKVKALAERIEGRIEAAYGFRPSILMLSAQEIQQAIADNPFPAAVTEPSRLHVSFLIDEAKAPDLAKMDRLKSATERYALRGRRFYLHAPDGIGRSKLASQVEACLGVSATGRNWRTVTKLAQMLS